LVTAGAALVGALGTQALAAFVTTRQKRYELWFACKGAAYKALITSAGVFAIDPKAEGAYLKFLAALDVATLYASPNVLPMLHGSSSINVSAQRLRTAQTNEELAGLQVTDWFEAMKRLSAALRQDLRTRPR
jgi:hypothetical protein